jgi:hypothetical protein
MPIIHDVEHVGEYEVMRRSIVLVVVLVLAV